MKMAIEASNLKFRFRSRESRSAKGKAKCPDYEQESDKLPAAIEARR